MVDLASARTAASPALKSASTMKRATIMSPRMRITM
jgi:hypothetical protein